MTKQELDQEMEVASEYRQKDMLCKVNYAILQLETIGYKWCKERVKGLREVRDYIKEGN